MKKLALLLAFGCVFTLSAQTDIEKVSETTSKSDIEGHIYFLADDLLKGRDTGTPELKIAASYLANSFRRYGVKPNPITGTYYQEVKLKRIAPSKDASIIINNQTITDYVLLNADAMSANQDAIFLNHGLADDYKGKDVKGKIAIIKAGSPQTNDTRAALRLRQTKEKLAIDNEVTAIIELLNADDETWSFIDHNFNRSRLAIDLGESDKSASKETAYVLVLDKDGTMAEQFSAAKTLNSKIIIGDKHEESVISQNVIGVIEGTDPKLKNEYIIYSAHYDHLGIDQPDKTGESIYNGARDNAVGTTTVLSMAKNIAKYPTKRSALFILFTAEEKGLLGSSYYVENPVLPLHQMVYCFNSDNAGYNDTSVISVIGLTRTSAENNIVT